MWHLFRRGGAIALLAAVTCAFGQETCAKDLEADELTATINRAVGITSAFRDAFSNMTLDTATSTVSTVGATLVGGAMAHELAAVAEGLRQVVRVRDRLSERNAREIAMTQLRAAMAEAGIRARRVSAGYGGVVRMSASPEVRQLAVDGMLFADGLSRRWSCQ